MAGTPAEPREVELARPITIRDLLTHTAGLTYDFLDDSPVGALYRQARLAADPDRSLEAMIAELARLPLAYQPGARWHYSLAIDVVAHLVEVLSGRPLQDVLQERLFAPLGMADTGFSVRPDRRDRVAAMYGRPDITTNSFRSIFAAWQAGVDERLDVEATYPTANTSTFARGGHGLFSTTADYMRFAQMLLNRGELEGARILAPKTCDLMHMNHLPAALRPFAIDVLPYGGYGFGLGSRVLMDVAESALPGSVGEFGWAGAATTHYWVDPQEALVGVVMAQSMLSFDPLPTDFRILAYQAMVG
jgi:CubicO group peptidase (beta-lactamase class C family)